MALTTVKSFEELRGALTHLKISKIPEKTHCQVDFELDLGIKYSKYFFSDQEYENLKFKHLSNKQYRSFMKEFFETVKFELINNNAQYVLPYSLGFIECGKMYQGANFKNKLKGFRSLKSQMGYIKKFRVVGDPNHVIYYTPFFNQTKTYKPVFRFDNRVYVTSYQFKSSYKTRNEFLNSLKYKDTRTLKKVMDIQAANAFKVERGKKYVGLNRNAEELLGRRSAKAEWLTSMFNNYNKINNELFS